DSLGGHPSSSQAAFIVPLPGSGHLYYVFTTSDHSSHRLLKYSVVDMCLEAGMGDVLITQKSVLLLDTITEKLTGTRHANSVDYWVVTHRFNSDAFYAYRLGPAGISPPVITH